ncbi:MAG TPA: lamin tail domain-containing protein [Candidatus Angelobacter sp.]|nr:lamin tail domain-containing protein [Candidatus Angelobacter sp.]
MTDTSLASPQTATLRFKARWLRGWPEVLLRVHGNWLEATGRLPLPANLGTPGAPNSRLVANAGPAIYEVTHTPGIPAANQNVVVTARLHDPNGLQGATLFYRVDPGATYSSVSMTDNGAGGDAIAGDGIYSATIPGKVAGSVVAFYIQATDSPGASSRFPAALNDNGPVRECVVYFGDTIQATGFGAYHYWLTSANIDRWGGLGNLSNEPIDGTWVYGSRVIYNMHGHFAGSPYHQQFDTPNGNYCHYHLDMPEDDQFLGTTSFNKIHAPGNGPFDDDTIQREQTSYWLVRKLGLPWNYRRYVAVYVNGGRRGTLMEDSQVPGGDVLNERFSSDANGDLYKLQPWFEFDPTGSGFNNVSWCTLNNYTTTGGAKKLARYRWNYLKRAVQDSANNYTNVFGLINAANTQGAGYTPAMDALVDTEQWMRTFAVEHAVGNWDAFGCQNEQNMYGYKPTQGKWQLMIWDYNIVLGNSGSWGPGQNLFSINGADGPMQAMYNNPPFLRAYWRALEELCNGPMLANNVGPVLDAKYAAFVADGVNVVSPSASVKGWIASARTSILSQAAAANANPAFAVNGPSSFSTNANQITLTGTAPVGVKTIVVNGVAYPVTWTTLTNWKLGIALSGGLNTITIQGLDNQGNVVSGATATVSINYTGIAEQPQGHLVINEIMYNSALPDASFVEILNTSTTNAFDLSGWRLDGADFTFPGGSIIQPNGFLVVAGDAQGFVAAYGSSIPLAGVFGGKLQNGGETLRLIKPGATPAQDVTIDEVTYDSTAPWPTVANGFGPSLQLIDPTQDNNRVANWSASVTNASLGPQWQYVTVTGTATSSRLYVYLSAPPGGGDAYVDDVKLVDGATPEVGTNYINDGAFETALSGSWNLTPNTAGSGITTSFAHAGASSLHLVCATNGTTVTDSIWQDLGPLTNGNQYTLSYWYLPNTNGATLTVRLSGSGVRSDQNIAPSAFQATALYTPGAPNSVRTNLASFPAVWLNEIQPGNVTGVQDRFGHHHPWVELYNSGASALNLSGYYLANNYSNLTQWPFPATTTINPGQFMVVFVDGNGGESLSNELHTSFAVPQASGTIVLTKAIGNQTTLVDYLNYSLINADRSYGAFPDGTPARRQKFYYATPGATNDSTWPAVPVTINEWMASNTGTLADPADGHYDDWFELYNAGPTVVDLSGYTLTDTPTNATQFTIPPGYAVPAGGYLLVWADNDTSQNATNSPELHTNFKLSGGGEFIGLYSPNGTNIDAVTFAAQTNDISQGRYPDGNSGQFYFMQTPTPGTANLLGIVSNQPPALSSIGAKSINEGSQLVFTAVAADPDAGQTLMYSLDPGAPQGASINPSSGVFIWTPSEAQGPGSYPITVRVTDNGSPALSDFETIAITVNEVNTSPSLAFVNNQSVNEGSLLTFVASASDPDVPANALTFSLDPGAPAGASINPTNGTFSWTPTEAQGPGTNSITVRVTDNGSPALSDAQTFAVVVNEVNVAPVLAPIGNKVVSEGSNLTFIATATDPDTPANTLLFSLDPGAPVGASINPTNGTFSWTPTEAQGPATNSITVRVTDNGSPAMSDAKTFTVAVNEVNVAPVLAATTNQTVTAGILLSITNSATDADMPANALSFSLDPGAPVGATITTSGLFTWTPSANQAPSTNSITVRVTDDGSPPLSDAKTFTIVVNATTELRVTTITVSANNVVTLNWNSQAGLTYRVEYKDDLGQTNWNSLGDFNASGASTSATNAIAGTLQRFYRIHQL